MTKSIVVHLTLQNLSTQSRAFSPEPYGEYCELLPDGTVHATWTLEADANVHLQIALTDDAVLVGDASHPLCELRPSRSNLCFDQVVKPW